MILIKYKINEIDKKIKLFDMNFINNNKKNCKYIYKNKSYELNEYFDLSNFNSQGDILEIKLEGIKNINNFYSMFNGCSSLLSLSCSSEIEITDIIDTSYMFYGCKSLVSLPDISKWKTDNVKDMI